MSGSFDLDSATVLMDETKFDSLDIPVSDMVEIHYRMVTPFKVKMGEDDDDVKIKGPVYVGNEAMLDRHSELVDMKAIMNAWKGYSNNPVILYNHSKTYGVIGRMLEVKMADMDGMKVPVGTAIIDSGEKDIVRKIRKGMLKAFSIGFIAKAAVKECKDEDSCYMKFTEIDWVETSVVDVPASPNALFSVEKSIRSDPGIKKDCGCGCKGEKESSCGDQTKAQVGADIYTTQEEAEARAEEIGCSGFHSMEDDDGRTLFMPCADHDAYEATAEERDHYDEDEEMGYYDEDEDKKSDLTASVKNQLRESIGSMTADELDVVTEEAVATEEESALEDVVETPITDAPIQEKTVDEEPEEAVEEAVEEAEEAVEEEVAEEEVEKTVPSPREVIGEVAHVLKSLIDKVEAIEKKLEPEEPVDEVASLKSEIEAKDAQIAELIAEKEAHEAEVALEAEVQRRVDEALAGKSVSTRKSIVKEEASKASKSYNKFDPTPEVSKGQAGLSDWLAANLTKR